jgi:hypothetical protein
MSTKQLQAVIRLAPSAFPVDSARYHKLRSSFVDEVLCTADTLI